jgi:signal transduction histidine kinase
LTFGVLKRLSNIRMRLPRHLGALQGLGWNRHALSLATLVLVVFALAVLQYRWIDQLSEAQEARTTSRVRENLRRITDAVDTEITRAVLVFTMPSMPGDMTRDNLEQAWATWHRDAPWPRIVSALWYLESADNGWRPHSWGDASTLDPRSILPRDDLVRDGPRGDLYLEVDGLAVSIGGRPCMLWPLPSLSASPASPRIDRVVICYDLGYLTDTFLPRLLEKHLTAEDRGDFLFQLEPRGPVAAGTVMTVDQFHFRPDCLMPDAGGPSLSVSGFEARGGIPPGAPDLFAKSPSGDGASLAALIRAEGACRTGPRLDSGLLNVTVRRPPGTSGDLFTRFRQRNLVVSGVVMTALLAALIALVVSTERARRLARLQTVIAAGISHELRSPLTSLNVASDHLKHGHVENAEQARRYGEIIDAQARRLRHVVDQALALTTHGPSNGTSNGHAVSVSEIVHAACDGLAPQASQAGIEIERRVAPDVPLASVDPDVLLRCLTNLIENSIKYAASGRWIRVSAQRAFSAGRPGIEVAVEDRGPGLEDDETTAVFEPFFRGSSARRTRQPGSGLGLAIVKNAVDAYGGGIALEPAVPHGCRIRLFFRAVYGVATVDSVRSEEPSHVVAPHTPD